MANEITLQYALPDRPDEARASWKSSPPLWLVDGGFKLVDETYDGLVYRGSNAYTKFGRLFSSGTYTLSCTFVSDGRFGSRVTVNGQAPPKLQELIRADAAAHGGAADPRVEYGGPVLPS
jgi:hypothetical protein